MNAIARKSAAVAVRSARSSQKQQKRNIVDWMTNYPDKVRPSFITKALFRLDCRCADSI